MTLEWTPRASRELKRQLKFIALDKPSAAERMARIIQETTSLLAFQPRIGRIGRVEGTFELVISGTPFLAVYRISGEKVAILRFLHGAQKWP